MVAYVLLFAFFIFCYIKYQVRPLLVLRGVDSLLNRLMYVCMYACMFYIVVGFHPDIAQRVSSCVSFRSGRGHAMVHTYIHTHTLEAFIIHTLSISVYLAY